MGIFIPWCYRSWQKIDFPVWKIHDSKGTKEFNVFLFIRETFILRKMFPNVFHCFQNFSEVSSCVSTSSLESRRGKILWNISCIITRILRKIYENVQILFEDVLRIITNFLHVIVSSYETTMITKCHCYWKITRDLGSLNMAIFEGKTSRKTLRQNLFI